MNTLLMPEVLTNRRQRVLIPGIRLAPSDINLATICIGMLPTSN